MAAVESPANPFHAFIRRLKHAVKSRIKWMAQNYVIDPIGRNIARDLTNLTNKVDQIQAGLQWSIQNAQTEAAWARNFGGSSTQVSQVLLSMHYRAMKDTADGLAFDDVGFKCYSQNSEDGILLYIFALIGTTNKVTVEICAGAGIECNSANLIVNHGWTGLLFDGDPDNIAAGNAFYRHNQRSFIRPPRLASAWITRDNINNLIRDHGVSGEIDLLSIDIDGNDYWIWEAIDCINPRVVIVECQSNGWGYARAVTMPYQEDFVADFAEDGSGSVYLGASLPAFVNLGRKKGYRLVGVERYGFNAFFIRDDIAAAALPEKSAKECLDRVFRTFAQTRAVASFYDKPWIDV